MDERRHDPEPHPPDGIERRHCSDRECMNARQTWYEENLLPRITVMFWKGVGATIFACLSGLFFIVSALIDRHTLQVEREFAANYVTTVEHDKDVKHLFAEFDKLSSEVTAATKEILRNQTNIMNKLEKKQ